MNNPKRKTIEGWIDKASNQWNAARQHVETGSSLYSEAIQAAQQCVELSVKSILSLLDVTYPPSHEWAPRKNEFALIAAQIRERGLLDALEQEHLGYTISIYRRREACGDNRQTDELRLPPSKRGSQLPRPNDRRRLPRRKLFLIR